MPFFTTRCQKTGTKPRMQIIVILTFLNVLWTAHDHLYLMQNNQINMVIFSLKLIVITSLELGFVNDYFHINSLEKSIETLIYLPQLLMLPLDKYMDRSKAMLYKCPYLDPKSSLRQSILQTTLQKRSEKKKHISCYNTEPYVMSL